MWFEPEKKKDATPSAVPVSDEGHVAPKHLVNGMYTVTTAPTVDRLLLFPCSAIMPESIPNWTPVNGLPRFEAAPNVHRVLLVLGNIAHMAGDMPLVFWQVLLGLPCWETIIYVPGPYDYGSGTLELGDSWLRAISNVDPRLVIFAHGCPITSVFFSGPRVLMRGAACFPVEPIHYQDARVYQRGSGAVPAPAQEGTDGRTVAADKAADLEAITECRWVTRERAQHRLDKDVATLLEVVPPPETATQVIVTYGCPDEMAAATRKKSAFHATVSLGNASIYRKFAALKALYWFCGAPTDKPTSIMYKSSTTLCSNCYKPQMRDLPDRKAYVLGVFCVDKGKQ
jgi:hypothetical protein